MTFPDFSDETIRKAREVVRHRLLARDDSDKHVWWVQSLRPGGERYRVQEDVRWHNGRWSMTWVTCSCPHGRNVGAGQPHCYHCASVLLVYLDTPRPVRGRSGVRGVYPERNGTWRARVKGQGVLRDRCFTTLDEAIAWRNEQAQALHGQRYVPSVVPL